MPSPRNVPETPPQPGTGTPDATGLKPSRPDRDKTDKTGAGLEQLQAVGGAPHGGRGGGRGAPPQLVSALGVAPLQRFPVEAEDML